MATIVTLRATNVTTSVVEDSVQPGTHDLFAHVRLATFQLKGSTPVIPANDDFVKITKTDGSAVAFAGLAKMPDTAQVPRLDLIYDVACQGWEALLDRINITTGMQLAANTTDVELVKAAIDTFYAAVGTGMTHKLYPQRIDLPFKVVPVGVWSFRSLMDWITGETGAPWWIEPSDKSFHYNDFEQFAPWVLSDVAGTGKKTYGTLVRHRDATARAVRVTVTDGGVNSTTLTDWEAWYELNSKTSEEPGSAGERFPQLVDIVDSTLDTVAKRTRAGFYALERSKPRVVLVAEVNDEGLDIGDQVDVISAEYGTGTAPHPWLEQWELGVTSTTEDLDTGMGRFMVTKVTPRSLGRDKFVWEIEMGDPNEIMVALIGRGDSR